MSYSSGPSTQQNAGAAPSGSEHSTIVQHLPQWFVAGFAVVYLSGYLIDFYHSSILGIEENGGDLLKLKYTQIGLSFIVFFLILAGPSLLEILKFLGVIFDRRLSGDERRNRSTRLAIAVFTIFYTASIYSAFLFTPAHYFQQDPRRIYSVVTLILVVQCVYIAATRALEKYQEQYAENKSRFPVRQWARFLGEKSWAARIVLCCLLIIVTAYCDYRAFKDLLPTFYECIAVRRGFIFFVICILFGVLVSRAIARISHAPIAQTQYTIIMVTSLLVIFYLGIVSYAYSIFPYIPSVKGGADFTNAPYVSVTFDNERDGTHREILDGAIEVYSNSASIFLAVPRTRDDVCDWRRGSAVPQLIQVERSKIWKIDIRPEQPEETNYCHRPGQR